ncbi:hypothetical protein ACIBG4_36965 [Nonomuraea sp. NPDC050383]|uniref:hypothetical protein n=1 Tax=Nonomuraea sp. NPDC050383 TaxID=3364362 RepID=UPI0037B265F5
MTDPGAVSLVEMLEERQHLLDIAARMSGSAAMADRVVRETYRRWYALGDDERSGIAVPRAWLTRVAQGICLSSLASGVPEPRSAAPPVTGVPARRPDPVAGPAPRDPGMVESHDRVARRFAAACGAGDAGALKAVLAAGAVAVSDGGGRVRAAAHPTHGAAAVARFVTALLAGRPGPAVAVESVNGRTGLVLRRDGRTVGAVSVSVDGTEVTAVWIVLNPDKLHSWHHP